MVYTATCYPSSMGTCQLWWPLLQHYKMCPVWKGWLLRLIEKYQFLSVVPCVHWQTQTCAWFHCSCLWFQEKYSCHYKQAIYLFVLPVINGQSSGFDCSYRRHSPILVIPWTAHFHCLHCHVIPKIDTCYDPDPVPCHDRVLVCLF